MTFYPYKGPRIIPNTIDCIFTMKADDQTVENVYQFRYGTAVPSVAALQNLAAELAADVWNAIRGEMNKNVTAVNVTAKDIGAPGRAIGGYNFVPGTIGLEAASDVPLNVAAHMTLRTAKQGRRFKGGKSFSGFSETHVNRNTLGDEIMSMLLRAGVSLLHTYVQGAFTPAVASLPHLSAPTIINAPAESNAITGVIVPDAWVDSQKTRLTNRGK
jgi:hypothetical protein